MNNEVAIRFENVSKTYRIRENRSDTLRDSVLNFKSPFGKKREIKALQNVSFQVRKGEKLGIIGYNGSGKSTLIKLIIGSLKPNEKSGIFTNGKIMRLELGLGFDKEMSARDNVLLNGSILGIPKKELEFLFPQIIAFADLKEYENVAVKYFSKGMKMRLAFSVAMHIRTDILLLDEFFGGGGDINFKKKSDAIFKEKLIADKTLVIVSHSLSTIKNYCDRVIWLDKGKVMIEGEPNEVIGEYKDFKLRG